MELQGENKGLGLFGAGMGRVGWKFASWKMKLSDRTHELLTPYSCTDQGRGMLVADMGSRAPRREGMPECQPRRSCPIAKQTDQILCVLTFLSDQ